MSHSATLRLLLAALQAVHEAAPAEHGATPEHGAHGGAHGGEHGGVHEAEEPESGEEPEEEEESHSIFALPTLTNKRVNLLTWIIVGLIGVTIAFERLTEFLEEEYFSSGIRKQIWQMMLRELTILGFVSFVATVILQFVLIPEEDKQIFEYAHVLMFTLAIFYAAQIAITAFQLGGIVKTFNKQDEEPDEDLLKAEKDYWERAAKTNPIRRFWRRCSFLNRATNNMISGSTFKVLRFHFMSRSGLLGKAKFEWAACARPPSAWHGARPARRPSQHPSPCPSPRPSAAPTLPRRPWESLGNEDQMHFQSLSGDALRSSTFEPFCV